MLLQLTAAILRWRFRIVGMIHRDALLHTLVEADVSLLFQVAQPATGAAGTGAIVAFAPTISGEEARGAPVAAVEGEARCATSGSDTHIPRARGVCRGARDFGEVADARTVSGVLRSLVNVACTIDWHMVSGVCIVGLPLHELSCFTCGLCRCAVCTHPIQSPESMRLYPRGHTLYRTYHTIP